MEKKRSLFFDTSLIYFVVIAGFVLIRILNNVINVGALGGNIFSVIIQVGLMLLVPFFMYKFIRKKNTKTVLEEFHIKKINIKAVLITILIGIVVYFMNLAVASFFNIFIVGTGYDPSFGMSSATGEGYSTLAFFGDLILTALLPGVCEEFCHRGLLVNGYKQLTPKKTIILVGFLVGLMHLNIEQFFYACVIGMFLTFLVYLTDSIIPSMIVHFLNNALGLYFAFAEKNNLPFGNLSKSIYGLFENNPIIVFGIIICGVLLILALLIFLCFMLLKQTRVKDIKDIAQKALASKQREMLLESFDLDVEEINKEQGITNATPEVTFSKEVITNGRRNIFVDFNFGPNNLMAGKYKKPSLKDKCFLFGTIAIGIIITISTLIWGII